MKFTLITLLAAMGITIQSQKYFSKDTTDNMIKDLIQNYGEHYINKNNGLGNNNQWSGQNNNWLGDDNHI